MSDNSGIEWTDATWNPVTGCTKVSPGCDHCYAETFAERFRGVPGHHFERGFDVVVRPERLDIPLRWAKPRRIFVNSMSDLFHDAVLKYDDGNPSPFIARVFARMVAARQHTFQVLTKRPGVMASLLRHPMFKLDVNAELLRLGRPVMAGGMSEPETPWPRNIWLGTSVEDDAWGRVRLAQLERTPAEVRFVSCEPLLGAVDLSRWIGNLDWVIVGGESGHGARPMHPDWARSLRDQCVAAGVPFLFKQAGSVLAREWGAHGKGADPADWPEPFPRELPSLMTEPTTIAYLAGIIDSDGYITASSSTRHGRTYCAPRVGISGTRREPHDLAASIWGGSVRLYTPTAERAHHRDQYQWVLEGDKAADVIREVLPFLRVKREQATLALELQEAREEARRSRTDEDAYPWAPADYDPTPTMVALAEDIRALNARGRDPE